MLKGLSIRMASIGLAASMLALPALTLAQYESAQHREQTKNEWRNIGIGAAALGVYGLLKGDNSLALIGAAGAAYAGNRYEQDRKSERNLECRENRYGYVGIGYASPYPYTNRASRERNGRHDNGWHNGWHKSDRNNDQDRDRDRR